jgi:hypothetical protein
MPVLSGIIDTISFPPLGTLNPVLDTGGPYGFGDHVLTTFVTGGAFALPAGTYQVHGTYGVIVVATTIPVTWGQSIGFDSGAALGNEGNRYWNRFCQLVPQHELFSGFWASLEYIDVHYVPQLELWPFRLIGGDRLGLHVEPDTAVDLYYLCVL